MHIKIVMIELLLNALEKTHIFNKQGDAKGFQSKGQ